MRDRKFTSKVLLYFSIVILCSFASGYATINKVNTMEEVTRYFANADCDTLIIFDIDMVLIQPSDPAFQMANMVHFRNVAKRISQSIPQEKKNLFLTLMLLNSDSILVDTYTPTLLSRLIENSVPTIALTSNLTGPLKNIASLEAWKINRLCKLGIDFTSSAPMQENQTFCDLPSYRGNYSSYKQGILFANGPVCPKGDVLIRFLQIAGLHPKRVIFIDDREDNLKNVEESLNKYNPLIQYDGIHYLGANLYPSPQISEQEFETKWSALAELTKTIN